MELLCETTEKQWKQLQWGDGEESLEIRSKGVMSSVPMLRFPNASFVGAVTNTWNPHLIWHITPV